MSGKRTGGRTSLARRDPVLRVLIPAAMLVLAGCHGSTGSNQPAAGTPTTPVTTAATAGTTLPGPVSSTTVPIQASGPRTVLSPLGLNVRAQPSKTAAVLGSAAQGATVTVLGHTDQGGGWYQVKGATVTGFITDNPTLSADGKFTPYSSSAHNFSVLYPDTWALTEAPPNSVVFHPQTSADSIVVSTATTVALLGRGRAGYSQNSSAVVVICGVTGNLVTFVQAGATTATSTSAGSAVPERYLVQIHLALDAQHALGVDANLADLAQLQTVKNVAYSLSFPFPQCEQGATPNQTSSTAPATTIH